MGEVYICREEAGLDCGGLCCGRTDNIIGPTSTLVEIAGTVSS